VAFNSWHIKSALRKLTAAPFILLVKFYQWFISPLTPGSCRHVPTCSQYTVEALREWGALQGLWLALKRFGKCHPWGSHGYDPVPKKESNFINSVTHHEE